MKLDRRAAIGILAALGLGLGKANGQTLSLFKSGPKSISFMMDDFKDFTVAYKGKTQTFTTDEVMNALFGEGTFGN